MYLENVHKNAFTKKNVFFKMFKKNKYRHQSI